MVAVGASAAALYSDAATLSGCSHDDPMIRRIADDCLEALDYSKALTLILKTGQAVDGEVSSSFLSHIGNSSGYFLWENGEELFEVDLANNRVLNPTQNATEDPTDMRVRRRCLGPLGARIDAQVISMIADNSEPFVIDFGVGDDEVRAKAMLLARNGRYLMYEIVPARSRMMRELVGSDDLAFPWMPPEPELIRHGFRKLTAPIVLAKNLFTMGDYRAHQKIIEAATKLGARRIIGTQLLAPSIDTDFLPAGEGLRSPQFQLSLLTALGNIRDQAFREFVLQRSNREAALDIARLFMSRNLLTMLTEIQRFWLLDYLASNYPHANVKTLVTTEDEIVSPAVFEDALSVGYIGQDTSSFGFNYAQRGPFGLRTRNDTSVPDGKRRLGLKAWHIDIAFGGPQAEPRLVGDYRHLRLVGSNQTLCEVGTSILDHTTVSIEFPQHAEVLKYLYRSDKGRHLLSIVAASGCSAALTYLGDLPVEDFKFGSALVDERPMALHRTFCNAEATKAALGERE